MKQEILQKHLSQIFDHYLDRTSFSLHVQFLSIIFFSFLLNRLALYFQQSLVFPINLLTVKVKNIGFYPCRDLVSGKKLEWYPWDLVVSSDKSESLRSLNTVFLDYMFHSQSSFYQSSLDRIDVKITTVFENRLKFGIDISTETIKNPPQNQ